MSNNTTSIIPIPLALSLTPSRPDTSKSTTQASTQRESTIYKCPDIIFDDIFGYLVLGFVSPILIWLIFWKLDGIKMLMLPFVYQAGGIKNTYSYDYLKIGE
jgi:hypothetical protein